MIMIDRARLLQLTFLGDMAQDSDDTSKKSNILMETHDFCIYMCSYINILICHMSVYITLNVTYTWRPNLLAVRGGNVDSRNKPLSSYMS